MHGKSYQTFVLQPNNVNVNYQLITINVLFVAFGFWGFWSSPLVLESLTLLFSAVK